VPGSRSRPGYGLTVPVGYLIGVVIAAIPMLLSLRPLARSGRLGRLSWIATCVINEWPLIAVYWVVADTALAVAQGDIGSAGSWVGVAIALVSPCAAVVLVRRSLRARRVVASALDAPPAAAHPGRILWAPLPFVHRDVARIPNISYADDGRLNTLDVYRSRAGVTEGAPILIHFHGGGFTGGRKSNEARPLLLRFARRGWLCISAGYRLRPAAAFPDFVIDAKRAVAWARAHAAEYGADPGRVFIAGSSAGAHLSAIAALTPNDPAFQPGFEEADTSVSGCVCLYGYYGPVSTRPPGLRSSPAEYVHAEAPPFLIAHGTQDTLVPPARASALAGRLREVSRQPVVWIELPGAQHSFDLLRSVRFEALVDGIEIFAARARD
jgi:acetyl esterase/lipase